MAREQFMKLIMVLASLSQIFITITSKTRLLWPTSSFSREFIILFSSSSSHCASINSRPIGVQCSLSLELNFVWKARHSTSKCPTLCFVLPMFLFSIKSASTRAVESESLKVWKSLKVRKSRKSRIWFFIRLLAKKYLINGDVLNAESEGSAQSHNNCSQTNYNFKMLITPERKVPQRSDTSQNDHKSKGYPSKTAFTMQKSDRGAYRRLGHQTFY